MSTLQIVLLSVAGGIAFIALIFMIMFLFEITISKKEKKTQDFEVKSIFSSEDYVRPVREDRKESTISSMLAKLDQQAFVEPVVEPVVEKVKFEEIVEAVKEEVVEAPVDKPVVEEIATAPVVEAVVEEPVEEVAEIQDVEVVEEAIEEKIEESVEAQEIEETIVEEKVEQTVEEVTEDIEFEPVVEEASEELVEETSEETVEAEESVEVEESVEESTEVSQEGTSAEVGGVKVEEIVGESISVESLPDYKTRLDKIIENRDKINKDLIKVEKSILNYERTKRRKARNQKMLDRRASELTNLNLVMYSVTDIKNVDEDKKIKQEELTSHIAELKASIQDAEEFLDSNKEKNEHDVKMAKFLIQEKARYNEEIVELQKLITKIEGNSN